MTTSTSRRDVRDAGGQQGGIAMYIGKREYSATVVAFRDILAKLDELDALLRDAPIDAADSVRFDEHVSSVRKRLTSELRNGEMELWEQNGYPTVASTERRR